MIENKIDILWEDTPVDITSEANFIWSIANKLRGSYMPDKYGDVIIPMTIIRRFECTLADAFDKFTNSVSESFAGAFNGIDITLNLNRVSSHCNLHSLTSSQADKTKRESII